MQRDDCRMVPQAVTPPVLAQFAPGVPGSFGSGLVIVMLREQGPEQQIWLAAPFDRFGRDG
jgi:hypothetical protein